MSNEDNELFSSQNEENQKGSHDDTPTEMYHSYNDPYTEKIQIHNHDETPKYNQNENNSSSSNSEHYNDEVFETQEIPIVQSREQYNDPNQYDSDDDYISILEDYYIENLPSEDVDGSGDWVYIGRYEKLLYEASIINRSNSIMSKNYDQIINSNSILKNEKKNLEKDLEESRNNEDAAKRAAKSNEISLDNRRKEVEDKIRKDKTLKIILASLLAIATILTIVFGILWNNSKNNSESISGTSSAQEKQINDLNSALQSEREAKSSIEQQRNDLQGRVDDLTTQINEANKSRDDLQQQLDKREEQLKELSDRIDELGDAEPQTITQTMPPEVQTITHENSPSIQTQYQTITETVSPVEEVVE